MTSLLATKKYHSLKEYENKAKGQLNGCLSFLKSHPTLSLTLIYLFISCFGLVYLYALFAKYQINILPHLEITDFALAAIHYPTSIVLIIALVLFTWLAIKLELLLRKIKLFNKMNDKIALSYMFLNPIFFYSVIFLIAIFVTNLVSANETYKNIKENKNQNYTVTFSNQSEIAGQKVDKLDNIQIIADTYKYLWVYVNESKEIHAIPQKNINVLIPTLNKEKAHWLNIKFNSK